jgi:hypothetical protein
MCKKANTGQNKKQEKTSEQTNENELTHIHKS